MGRANARRSESEMRAALLWERSKPLEVRSDVELRPLGPRELRLRLAACGICHSDLAVASGVIAAPMPCVLGHESAGVVEAIGSEVAHVRVGDHGIVAGMPACGRCRSCLRAQPYLCQSGVVMGADGASFATPPPFLVDGRPVTGALGCFAEQLIVHENALIPIAPELPLDLVSLIGCCVVTGVGAAIHAAQVRPGSSVAVIGCGGVGASAIQGARLAGAAEIVAVDPVPAKRELALRLGATHAVAPEQLDALRRDLTAGEGFDAAIECVGLAASLRCAIDAVRRGGTVAVAGMGAEDDSIALSAVELASSGKTLRGCLYGNANARLEFEQLARLWQRGALDLDALVSRRLPLEDIAEGFRAMEAGEVIRCLVMLS
jgi:S-(hydroxymethyl)glutathione dehydrogenase/alcohol dehydrogenase